MCVRRWFGSISSVFRSWRMAAIFVSCSPFVPAWTLAISETARVHAGTNGEQETKIAAIRQLRNTLEMDPNQRLTHIFLRDTYVQKGMYQEAISETARVHAGTNGEQETKIAADLRKAYASSGERGFWQKFLDLP